MPRVYEFDGLCPVVHPTAFVHPQAVLIGDVIVGANCFIGPCAVLRGDFGRILVKDGANVQDGCVMHGLSGQDSIVDVNAHIGHGAVLHGCHVQRDALVGMNAVILDFAVIGEASLVAAMSLVKKGDMVPPRSLVAGIPARVIRPLREDEIYWKRVGTGEYQRLAAVSRATMREVEALTEVEPDRPRSAFAAKSCEILNMAQRFVDQATNAADDASSAGGA